MSLRHAAALAGLVAFASGLLLPSDHPAHAVGSAIVVDPGGAHTCALNADRETRCWGWNFYGQVGDGSEESRYEPTGIDLPASLDIATGGFHTCAVLLDGAVQCWGLNDAGQLGNGTSERSLTPLPASVGNATAIAAATSQTCAITNDGVVCWGDNASGQLGNGTFDSSALPLPVCAHDACDPLDDVERLALGSSHACAISSSQGLLCWGSNASGQLSAACDGVCATPVALCLPGPGSECLDGAGILAITAGAAHTCALTYEDVFCWGDNTFGQLGDGTEERTDLPVAVVGLESPTAIAAGLNHTCALSASTDVTCWGMNAFAQLGNGSGDNASTPIPVEGLADDIVDIAAGSSHTCVVLSGGALQCWGWNADGRLGDGTFSRRDEPVDVLGFGPKPTPTPTRTSTLAATPITPTSTSTPPPAPGDADCDGLVTAVDAALVLQLNAGLLASLPCAGGDVNDDGRVDSVDAALILQFVAGLLDEL